MHIVFVSVLKTINLIYYLTSFQILKKMNFLNKYNFVYLLAVVFLMSCNPQNLDEIVPEEPDFTPTVTNVLVGLESAPPPVLNDNMGVNGFLCNTLLFPFNVEQSDGTVVTVEDQDQYDALVATGDDIELLLPFSLYNDVEETIYEVNDFEELLTALLNCGVGVDTVVYEICDTEAHVLLFFNAHNIFTLYECPFDINYPVKMIVNSSPTSSTVADLNEYFATSGAPSNIQEVELIYPITVTQDGTEITLNNDQEICDFITGC